MPPAPPVALAETCTVPLPELPKAVAVALPPDPEFAPPFPPIALAETDTGLLPVVVPRSRRGRIAARCSSAEAKAGPDFQPSPPVPPTARAVALTLPIPVKLVEAFAAPPAPGTTAH